MGPRSSRRGIGSTDGLVNVSDTNISDEDEVVIQAFNHGSVHHAGFLNNTEVYALSHDEKFALYDMAEEQEKGSATLDFGDIREILGCQYIADVFPKHQQSAAVIGAGAQEYVALPPMTCLSDDQLTVLQSTNVPTYPHVEAADVEPR